jgi:hypothetical protein
MRRPWERHPPWAHWSFFAVWVVAGTLGPIALVEWIFGIGHWWRAFVLCGVWAIDLAVDWLLVRRLQRGVDGWRPWQPPTWKSLSGPGRG